VKPTAASAALPGGDPASVRDHAAPSLSVVIPNYNYASFVGDAIESALNVDWPAVEVIVVDDGSTDESRSVIERYTARVTTIFQRNSGQREACNAGFARSHGDVVIFLDSDDLLDPTLMSELARVWHGGVSKVQFQMKIIDAAGHPTGAFLPQFGVTPSAERIRKWARSAASYPTPPGSGNAYARTFLEQIFPLAGSETFSDSYCLAAAPYLGDVVTIAKPLVSYRVHGRNAGAMSDMDPSKFGVEVTRARWRFGYAQQVARAAGLSLDDEVFGRSLSVLAYRLASLRVAPAAHPLPGDSVAAILRDFSRGLFVEQGLSLRSRSVLMAWAVLVALAPGAVAERLVSWRFAPAQRPAALSRLLRSLGVLRHGAAPG
jgi:glycosyltransferase involved in cell wall biosynthesis